MPNIASGIYWCSRDLGGDGFWSQINPLKAFGNHHYILIVDTESQLKSLGLPEDPKSKSRDKDDEKYTVWFYTMGGFKVGDNLVYTLNDENDIKATNEYIDPAGFWGHFDPDFDFQKSDRVSTDINFARRLVRLANNYKSNPEKYDLNDENCAAWVNSILMVAGIPRDKRLKYGEFWGIDWGEEDKLDLNRFNDAEGARQYTEVKAYLDVDYKQTETPLFLGMNNVEGLEVSSLRIPAGYTATLFKDTKGKGDWKVLTENTPNLVPLDWNDKAKGILVTQNP